MKKIVMTGGGTAGHVTPNIALIPKLQELGYEINYIGSKKGIEKKLIEELGIPYYGISSGKLRRYHDIKNFTDPFKVFHGFDEANRLMRKLKPDVVFSKGGYVTVPVVLAAHLHRVPIVIHESDMTPGLANKIALPRASKICCNFPETKDAFSDRATVTGTPIRQELFQGSSKKAFEFCGFTEQKPTVLIIGGSTGSAAINKAIWDCLDTLLKKYNVVHLCGKDKLNKSLVGKNGYVQYEYIKDELADLFALADIVVSRAGANAICELLALRKPNILIPLPLSASRGDQILNAESFAKSGYSYVLKEEDVDNQTLLSAINEVFDRSDKYIDAMNKSEMVDSINSIAEIIQSVTK